MWSFLGPGIDPEEMLLAVKTIHGCPDGGGWDVVLVAGKTWAVVVGVIAVVVVFLLVITLILDSLPEDEVETPLRSDVIPDDAVKGTPATDFWPPILNSTEWEDPIPMPGPVNTAGAEDSPFMLPDGKTFFFFFTPDVTVPVQEQLLDKVTGIWWTRNVNGTWTEPEKIILCDDVSLDGAEFVAGDSMWFASVRAGNLGEIDVFFADYEDEEWTNVRNAGELLNVEYDIGEFTLSPDGETLYFHSGSWDEGESMDIFSSQWTGSTWGAPVLVPNINTPTANEGFPFITPDGQELWLTSTSRIGQPGPALFRSLWTGTGWGAPVEIASSFAGECTLDEAGNLYFVHHYYTEGGTMIEADIYVAYKKTVRSLTEDDVGAALHSELDLSMGPISLAAATVVLCTLARRDLKA